MGFSSGSVEKGHGNPLQYSCLENPVDRGAWWATVHGVAKSWTWLKWLSMHALMAQWSRICLSVHESWVQSLVWEDPACHGAAKPVSHNYWICALEPGSCNNWAHVLQLLKPACPRAHAWQHKKPPQWEAPAPQLERIALPRCNQRKASAAMKRQHSQK